MTTVVWIVLIFSGFSLLFSVILLIRYLTDTPADVDRGIFMVVIVFLLLLLVLLSGGYLDESWRWSKEIPVEGVVSGAGLERAG